MPAASYVVSSFLGGEWSQLAQGRYDLPNYRTALNVCLNGHPIESGAWTRRAGSRNASHTKAGNPGRVLKFDFQASAAYTIEVTDGFMRWRAGTSLAMTNDAQVVVAISAANPAVVQTTSAHGWVTGNTVMFSLLDSKTLLLQNRQFTITKTDNTHFSLQDALTGANIDGSTLGALQSGATVSRIQELTTPYVAQQWKTLRTVQAETTAILLQTANAPQIMQVTTLPNVSLQAQFSLGALTFLDGPYLDPFTNGVQVTPASKSGNVVLTLGFAAYSSTQAYKVGDFVTSSSVNYKSLVDDNVNNTPVSSPSQWATTSAGAAINNGQGFLGTDVGRLVRLLSEPAAWASGTTYAAGNLVSYNPTMQPGAETFWTSLVGSNVGNIPGQDTTHWQLTTSNAAVWSWGKIISLANQISQTLAGVANIGDMTRDGGLAAAFDSVINQVAAACAGAAGGTFLSNYGFTSYVGRNFSGASAQAIQSVTIFPSSDDGFIAYSGNPGSGVIQYITINLRAKASLPASSSDGTLLATTGQLKQGDSKLSLPISLISSDQVTTWNYVWVEFSATGSVNQGSLSLGIFCAEMQQFNPPGSGSATGVTIELLGPPLLYTNPVITWRLGTYSNTTGWPTCGCYHEGRLWLGGAVANRFDASVSNGIQGTTINFAPTDQNGVVAASNGISYTLNSDGVNPTLWMIADQQGVLMGTLAGEWLASPPSAGPMSPLNIAARRVTKNGSSANIEPIRTEHTLVFVQRYARKLMEYFADVFSGKFSAPNLAEKAMHLTKPAIAEIAYQQATAPIIWARTSDGNLRGITYKRDTLMTSQGPTYVGWHRHTLGSGRIVESIAVGPSVGGTADALTMVTNDAATNIRHVEVLSDTPEEGVTLAAASYLDDAVNPTSTTTSNVTPAPYGGLTLNGLWHLNGKTVQAWIGGLDCGLGEKGVISDFVVSNGSITVPYGDGISAGSGAGLFTAAFAAGVPLSQMLVGFTFTSQGQCVRPNAPAETGARSGPAFGKKRRNEQFAVQVEGTQGVSFGETFTTLYAANFRAADDATVLGLNQQFTGIHWDQLDCDYTFDGMIAWQVTRPYICNIAAIGPRLETQD